MQLFGPGNRNRTLRGGGPQDWQGSTRLSHYDYPSPSGLDGPPVRATVKWFNGVKGFGFVAPSDGTPDAFLHASVLSRVGLSDLAEGAEVMVVIGPGPKGPQVIRLVDVIGGGSPRRERPAPSRAAPGGPEVELEGSVKWFKDDKGFGFVTTDDGGKDVFVHKSILRRAGLESLQSGERVLMRVTEAPKGREATWIQLLD